MTISKLDGSLQKRLSSALTTALPTKSDWERMISYELNESLDKISSLGSIDNIAFEVIRWAISRGRLHDLINGAQRHNDTNPELFRFCHEIWLPLVDADTKSRREAQIAVPIDRPAAYGCLGVNTPSSTLSTLRNNGAPEILAKPEDVKAERSTGNVRKGLVLQQLYTHPLLRNEPIALYYSYVDKDAGLIALLQRQLVMLSRSGLITVWHRGMAKTGEDEYVEQLRHLNTASVILLFVSPHSLECEHTYNEAERAMQRFEAEGIVVIPIICRPTADWQLAPFGGLRSLPGTGKALVEYIGFAREKQVKDIALAIRGIVHDLIKKQI